MRGHISGELQSETERFEGKNVVLHEFAHQLDQEDGTPVLGDGTRRGWAEVLGSEFRALRDKASRDEPTLLDHYGAEDAGEFFARGHGVLLRTAGRLSQERPQALRGVAGHTTGGWIPGAWR